MGPVVSIWGDFVSEHAYLLSGLTINCVSLKIKIHTPVRDPARILQWFVLRWQLEVTFQEVRAHLGVETQRQWSDRAIARTTPILMGIFSWTTLAAHLLRQQRPRPIAQQLGMPSRCRPSWMPSLWFAATCGWRLRVLHCPPPTLIYGKSRPLCTTGLSIPLLTPLELRKVQLGGLSARTGPMGQQAPDLPGGTGALVLGQRPQAGS